LVGIYGMVVGNCFAIWGGMGHSTVFG
jgi:hypothetical protein